MAFAKCVERRAPDRVAELMATEPGSEQEKRRVQVIAGAYNACILTRDMLSFPIGLFRGQLAELAFQADPSLLRKASELNAGAVTIPDVAAIDKAAVRVADASRDLYVAEHFRAAYAECLVAANPRPIATIIPTAVGSADERKAFLTEGSTLMACMPQGVTYSIKLPELRPYLVYRLHYRIVREARPGA